MDRAAVPVVVAYLCSSETKHSVSIWTSSTTRGVVVTPIECFFSRSQSRPPSIRSIGGALSRFDSARASLVKVPVVISRPYSPRPSTTPWVWALALVLLGLGAGAAQTGATGLLLAAVPPARIVTATVVWSQLGILGSSSHRPPVGFSPSTLAMLPSDCCRPPPPPCWPYSPRLPDATPRPSRRHPTTYVIAEQDSDNCVPVSMQDAMAPNADNVVRLSSAHMVQLSHPDELAEALESI